MATATARRAALTEFARARREAGGSGRGVRRVVIAIALAAILGTLVAWLAGFFGTPREIRDLRALVDQEIASLDRVTRNEMPFDEAATNIGTVFERMRTIPEAQRPAAWREVGRLFEARETVEVSSFFRLPAAERDAELDRRIRAEEERRKARDAARAAGGDRGGSGGPPRGGPPGGFAGGPPSGGGPPGGAPTTTRGGRTEEDRNQRSKAAIDRTTPEQRAMRTEYRRVMQERRAKLGLADRRW